LKTNLYDGRGKTPGLRDRKRIEAGGDRRSCEMAVWVEPGSRAMLKIKRSILKKLTIRLVGGFD